MSDFKIPSAKPTIPLPAANHAIVNATELVDEAMIRTGQSGPQQRIELIRSGIPASRVGQLSARMGISKEYLIDSLRLSRAAVRRKEKEGALLSSDESERMLGIESLIDLVQGMVDESGNPERFDAARWLSTWLSQPLPALGGATPASYMDTFEGQKLVAGLLLMMQSGAYA